MKTSLNLSDSLFLEAKKEAQRQGRSMSEVISEWANEGRLALAHRKGEAAQEKELPVVRGTGAPRIDVNSRRAWMEILEDPLAEITKWRAADSGVRQKSRRKS